MSHDHLAWVLATPSSIPSRWRERAVPMMLIPLVDSEVERFYDEVRLAADLSEEEERVAALTARGLSPAEVATELHLSKRTVYRRLRRLRAAVGATTPTELVAFLAQRGFGGS